MEARTSRSFGVQAHSRAVAIKAPLRESSGLPRPSQTAGVPAVVSGAQIWSASLLTERARRLALVAIPGHPSGALGACVLWPLVPPGSTGSAAKTGHWSALMLLQQKDLAGPRRGVLGRSSGVPRLLCRPRKPASLLLCPQLNYKSSFSSGTSMLREYQVTQKRRLKARIRDPV